jgi:hypothetical protein
MKGGKPHTYTLGTYTVALIKAWRTSSPFVSTRRGFPNAKGTNARTSLQKPWPRIKKAA